MKLSKDTVKLLKNFSSINDNILFEPGNVIKTKTPDTGYLFAEAEIEEDFPKGFGVYDLSSFLPILSSFENPNLSFSKNENDDNLSSYAVIKESDGKSSFQYNGSTKRVLDFPEGELNLPDMNYKFDLKEENLNKIRRMAQVAQLESIIFEAKDGKLIVSVTDTELNSSNKFDIELNDDMEGEFKIQLSQEVLDSLISGNYSVRTDGDMVVSFQNQDIKLRYLTTTENE